jgi:formate dehydrogenase maturation protein FdhE
MKSKSAPGQAVGGTTGVQCAGPDRWAIPLRAALDDLEREIAGRPELELPGRTLARILAAAFGRQASALVAPDVSDASAGSPEMEAIQTAWAQGRPAAHAVNLDFDKKVLATSALSIMQAWQHDAPPEHERFCEHVRRAPDSVRAWACLALRGERESLERAVVEAGLDARLVETVIRLVVLPELAPWAESLCEQLGEGTWSHGSCPVCASSPVLAESRGLERRRYLRCDRCAADWPCDRFRCAFCDQSDHRTLRYQFADGEGERRRLQVCDRCGGRLKIVATLARLSAPALLVAELAAVHLELFDDALA